MSKVDVVEKKMVDPIFCSNVGDQYYSHVGYKYDEKHNCMVPFDEPKFNLYEKIQLSKTQCDLDVIMKRAKAGDVSVLHVKNEFYGDVSDMPDNLNDFKNLAENCESSFNALPKEIKNLFNNDLSNFSKAIENGSFNDTINNYILSLGKKKDKVEPDKGKEETK